MIDHPNQYHRRSVRLKDYDYSSPGAYFVTAVTYQRECLLGKVVDGKMRLNEFGVIGNDEWFHTANLRPSIRLYPEEFTVMPNHVHGIIWIEEMNSENGRGAATLRPYAAQDRPFDFPPDFNTQN